MDQIAIVVLNWKKPQLTIDTVNSLLQVTTKTFHYQIILVDNHSPDNSLQLFKQTYSDNKLVTILQTPSNQGYVGGNNFGIEYSLKHKYTFTLLINNDVIVDPDFLIHLYLQSRKNNYHLLGPKIYFAPGFEFHKTRYHPNQLGKVIWSAGGQMDWNNILGSNIGIDQVDTGQFDQILENPDFLSGCCLLIKNSVFQKIGLLDPVYFMYLEDVDFCQKAKINNFKLAYIPKSVIWHINAGSSASGSSLFDYFITRNRLIFASRYARPKTKFALTREALKFVFSSNSWKRKAVFDYYFHNWGRGSW